MRLAYSLLVIALLFGTVSCKKEDITSPQTRTELLTTINWRVERISDPNGGAIAVNRLGAEALVLTSVDFQFTSNNIARALDRGTKQIINGGTWFFADNNESLDVKVTGFSGIFPIIELTRTRFVLRRTTKVDGKDAPINLEFIPAN